jgi:hypothetical protein
MDHDTISIYTHIAQSKENLLTVKKNPSQKSKLLRARICSKICPQQKFARRIEKLLKMKNLAGSDGSTQWLNVSHHANRSTAGAHHSTFSVVTAGTCWAGPSCRVSFAVTETKIALWMVNTSIPVKVSTHIL